MKRLFLILLLAACCCTASAQKRMARAAAISPDKTHVLLILDCSNSMWDKWQSDSKIKVTQTVLLRFMDSISHQNEVEFALRVFGHLNSNDYSTRLEVPFEYDNNYKIKSKIKTLVPQGGCTVTTALSSSLNDFPANSSSRNIILIVTDGIDDCEGSICQVARNVQMSGVVVKTFILGIGDKRNFKSDLNCAGKFIHIPNEESYTQALYDVFALSEEKSEVVLSLADNEGKAYETSVPVAFYDVQTGVPRYQTLYSQSPQSQPDTLTVDPLVDYNVTFFTNPPTTLRNVKLVSGKVNRISAKAEQGSLRIRYDGRRTQFVIPDYPVVVRRSSDNQLVGVQKINEEVCYLSGKYNVEILSQPEVLLSGIDISYTSNVELAIPTPGLAVINKPKGFFTGSVFSLDDDGTMKKVCDLNESKVTERIVLMPGEYVMIFQPRDARNYRTVQKKRFRIESAQQTNID